MPFKLRKAPKKDLYWVVNKESGKKYSKDPLPKERALAQMRALYASDEGGGGAMIGGNIQQLKDAVAAAKAVLDAAIAKRDTGPSKDRLQNVAAVSRANSEYIRAQTLLDREVHKQKMEAREAPRAAPAAAPPKDALDEMVDKALDLSLRSKVKAAEIKAQQRQKELEIARKTKEAALAALARESLIRLKFIEIDGLNLEVSQMNNLLGTPFTSEATKELTDAKIRGLIESAGRLNDILTRSKKIVEWLLTNVTESDIPILPKSRMTETIEVFRAKTRQIIDTLNEDIQNTIIYRRDMRNLLSRKGGSTHKDVGGSKSSGFIKLMIAEKKLKRTEKSYEPPAKPKSTPELFDSDLIKEPSKYIKEEMYEESGRIRTAMEKMRNIKSKNIVRGAVKQHVIKWKDRAIGAMSELTPDDLLEFINSYKRDGVEGIAYSAFSITGELMWLHLLRKYKNDCYVVSKKGDTYVSGIDITINGNPQHLDVDDLVKTINDCLAIKAPLVIIPLRLPKHQNMMIYRPTLNTLERFEPHGEYSGFLSKEQNDKLDANLEKFFVKKVFPNLTRVAGAPPFRYLKPQNLRSGDGFQALEGIEKRKYEMSANKKLSYSGFCQMWAFFYLELCMRNPKMTGKEVIDKAFSVIEERGGTEKWLKLIGAYVESNEKEIQKLIEDFSFSGIQSEKKVRGQARTELFDILDDYRRWFNEEVRKIILERLRRRSGGRIMCSCKGGAPTHRENVLKRLGLEEGQSLANLSKVSGVSKKTLQEVYNRGIGAYKTNPQSVRMKGSFKKNVKAPMSQKLSKEQWAMARVYSFLDNNPKHDQDLRGGVTISKPDFIKEHENLLRVLKSGKPSELKKEAADQQMELSKILKGGLISRNTLQQMAQSAYPGNTRLQIGPYKLQFSTPTLKFYKSNKDIVVAIRGTQPTNAEDRAADGLAIVGRLKTSARYKRDLQTLLEFQTKYPKSEYHYIGVAHSLGAAIMDGFIRAGLLKNGLSYNGLVEPQEIVGNPLHYRVYHKNDPLYLAVGKYIPNVEVRTSVDGWKGILEHFLPFGLGTLFKAYDSHRIGVFRE